MFLRVSSLRSISMIPTWTSSSKAYSKANLGHWDLELAFWDVEHCASTGVDSRMDTKPYRHVWYANTSNCLKL